MPAPPKDVFGLLGTTLERKFRIERIVAQGGFGIVYQATHTGLDRRIALKVLRCPTELNEQARAIFIDTFRHEARAIARLNHPSIVQVLDFGAADMPSGGQAPYMALEWLEGRTLHEELLERRNHGGRSVPETLMVLRPVLEALAYAHEEGIAHRDIKPANIMVVPTRRGPVLKLLDFGIAKAMEGNEDAGSGVTRTDSSLKAFSMAYAAPEQIGGARTGPWTDVHAMALIFTEVLTDLPPYDGQDRTEVVCDILSPTRPTPAKRRCDAGPWEQVLGRALALRPADRFASAGEMLSALEAVLPAHELPPPTGRFAAIAATQTRPSGSLFGVPTIPPGMVIQPPAPPVPQQGAAMPPYAPPGPQQGAMHNTGPFQPGAGPSPTGPHNFAPQTFGPSSLAMPPSPDAPPPTTLRGVETSSHVINAPNNAAARKGPSMGVVVGAAAVATLLVVAVAVPLAVMKLRTPPPTAAAQPHVVVVPPPPVQPVAPQQANVVPQPVPQQPSTIAQQPPQQQPQQPAQNSLQQPPQQPAGGNGASTVAGNTAEPAQNGAQQSAAQQQPQGGEQPANGETRRGRGRNGRGGRGGRGGNANTLIEVD